MACDVSLHAFVWRLEEPAEYPPPGLLCLCGQLMATVLGEACAPAELGRLEAMWLMGEPARAEAEGGG